MLTAPLPARAKQPRRLDHLMLLALLAPFYLNDFANIYVHDWRVWLCIDYLGVKLLTLTLVGWLIASGRMSTADFGCKRIGIMPFLSALVLVAGIATLIDQNGYHLLRNLPGYAPSGGIPAIQSRLWSWIDLTFGLLLVGITEELVFRGYLRTYLGLYTENRIVIVALSAIAFGLIHWSLGLNAVLITAVIGAVFMTAYLIVDALPPIMLAHFTVNFIDFAGIVPKSAFNLG